MRKAKLTKTEKNIEKSLKKFIPVDKREYKQIKQAISKKTRIADPNMPTGHLKLVKDFLPAPEDLVVNEETKKITIP